MATRDRVEVDLQRLRLDEPGLDEGDFGRGNEQEYARKLCLKGLRDLADSFAKEYEQIRPETPADAAGWQHTTIASLKPALGHLQAVITFLETGNNLALTKEVFEDALRYAELLGPVIMSCSLVAVITCADSRLHRSDMKSFKDRLANIDHHLGRLESMMPRIGGLLKRAGQKLECLVQEKKETGIAEHSRQLGHMLIGIEVELNISQDHLKRVEDIIFELQNEILVYKREKKIKGTAVVAGAGLTCAALKYFDKIDSFTQAVFTVASGMPLLYYLMFLQIDIADLMAEIKMREENRKDMCLELDALKKRLRVLKWSYEMELIRPNQCGNEDSSDGRMHSV